MGDYLISRNGFWWFRMALPEDVKVNFGWTADRKGRPEVLTHLGLADRGKDAREQARAAALTMAIEVRQRIRQAREANHLRNLGENYSGGECRPLGEELNGIYHLESA